MTDDTPLPRSRPRGMLAALIIIGLFLAVVVGLRVAGRLVSIPSASMEPTLLEGDTLVVSHLAYRSGRPPQRGDIAMFRVGGSSRLARVIGLPGERVQMRAGVLSIDGRPVQRVKVGDVRETTPYGAIRSSARYRETLPGGASFLTNDFGPDGELDDTPVLTVPPGRYFVLGDNRDNAADSRVPAEEGGAGLVPAGDFVGRAVLVLASPKGGRAFAKP